MKRVVVAAIMVAAVGLVGFDAPARGLTNYAGTMVTSGPAGFKFSKGTCESQPLGDGVFNIQVGDSVTWKNCTQVDHTVTGQGFGDTSHITPQGTFSHTFNTPGSFPYHCDIHASMTGAVNVAGEPTTVPATQPPTTTPPTTAKPAATTTSTAKPAATTTTADIFDLGEVEPESSTTSTTGDPTVTTRALGEGGDGGTSAGLVAALIVGLGAVGTAGALVIRRMRGGAVPPS